MKEPKWNKWLAAALVIPALLASANTAECSSYTTVIQPGPNEGKDTNFGTVYETDGRPDSWNIDAGGWGDYYYSFIEFDLAGAPSAAATVSVTFELIPAGAGPVNDPGIEIHRITEAWQENTVNKWNYPAATYFTDYAPVSPVGEWHVADITSLYKSWKNGTWPNYGIKLHSTHNNNTAVEFYSSDYLDDPTLRPRLVIVAAPEGDLNLDGFVGIADLNIILANWNQFVPPGDSRADVGGVGGTGPDGFVGINDLNVVLGNWNAGTPPGEVSSVVPEPASLSLLGLGGIVMIWRR